jgi:hypothetical protein
MILINLYSLLKTTYPDTEVYMACLNARLLWENLVPPLQQRSINLYGEYKVPLVVQDSKA